MSQSPFYAVASIAASDFRSLLLVTSQWHSFIFWTVTDKRNECFDVCWCSKALQIWCAILTPTFCSCATVFVSSVNISHNLWERMKFKQMTQITCKKNRTVYDVKFRKFHNFNRYIVSCGVLCKILTTFTLRKEAFVLFLYIFVPIVFSEATVLRAHFSSFISDWRNVTSSHSIIFKSCSRCWCECVCAMQQHGSGFVLLLFFFCIAQEKLSKYSLTEQLFLPALQHINEMFDLCREWKVEQTLWINKVVWKWI